MAKIIGETSAEFVLHGFSGVGGMPLDVSMRMGMGNLLPGTGLLKKSETDKDYQYAEFGAAAGAYGQKVMKAASKAIEGDVAGAAREMAGTAISNIIKARDMMEHDVYRDSKGRKVIDTDAVDAVIKGIGFQPGNVVREQKERGIERQDIAMAKAVKAESAEKWAQSMYEGDTNAAKKAQEVITDWNAKNPEAQISVNSLQILRRVREMRMSKEQRMLKSAPKSMRPALMQDDV